MVVVVVMVVAVAVVAVFMGLLASCGLRWWYWIGEHKESDARGV